MSQISINTTQNVEINFTLASIGERIGAYFLDMLIKTAYIIVVFYVLFKYLGIEDYLSKLDRWSEMAVGALFFLPVAFYSLIQETLLEGQTLGKKIVKIKVVKIDGYQASFGDYLIRWMFRLIDIDGTMGFAGLISMVVNSKVQRLGDISAGTAVISLKSNVNISHTILEEIGNEYQPMYPLVIKLSDNDARIIKETFNAAMANSDFVTLNKLSKKIEDVTGIKNDRGSAILFIQIVLKDYNYYTQHM